MDHQIFTLQVYGGISRYFVKLAEELLRGDEEVKIFVPLTHNNYLPGLPHGSVAGFHTRCYSSKLAKIFLILKDDCAKFHASVAPWRDPRDLLL
ncbi:MAG: hypothetical protein ACOY41_04815 [Pseudomonadota bacterium]